MARRKKEEAVPQLNMTPMIDVVFNLVIVTDLTQKELENLTLPQAYKAKEDKATEKDERVIINIVEDENTEGKYISIIKKKPRSHAELKDWLQTRADTEREDDKPYGSKIFVLIRADRSTPWQQVQWIMQDCADPDVRIWKLQFATRDETKGGGAK